MKATPREQKQVHEGDGGRVGREGCFREGGGGGGGFGFVCVWCGVAVGRRGGCWRKLWVDGRLTGRFRRESFIV